MSTFLPHPALSLTLLLLWLLLNNTLAAGHIVLGSVLALLIPWLTRAYWPETVRTHHPVTLLRFVLLVIWDILVANVNVARLILGPPSRLKPGFIRIPLELQSPIAISLLANTISLTPGTVSCDLAADHRSLLVHALHLEDASGEIANIKNRYETPLKEIFG